MLPSNVDPRRPDKIQRYKPPTANGTGQGEDLTPDYMNILGQRATADVAEKFIDGGGGSGGGGGNIVDSYHQQQPQQHNEEHQSQPNEVKDTNIDLTYSGGGTNATTNVIPTSPQYGVAIIPNNDLPSEAVAIPTDTIIDTTAKASSATQIDSIDPSGKELHTTPSKNDRFKVVKIASLEPFKRGRWKCMDYLDEVPTSGNQQKIGQVGVGTTTGGIYLQTQSLPQQQIQQMLMQSGYTNGTQFYNNPQVMAQAQFFYPPGANMQPQTLPQQLVNATSSVPTQYIATSQPYFTGGGVVPSSGTTAFASPLNYPNVQYVAPPNVIQNQTSAFVPTSQQLPTNFQQSQTYAGQTNVSQAQPMVNGHVYTGDISSTTTTIPTQTTKNVMMTTNAQQPVVSQQQQQTNATGAGNQLPVQTQPPTVIPNQYPSFQPQSNAPPSTVNQIQSVAPSSQTFDQTQANVYANPQFDLNVNSATLLENSENSSDAVNDASSGAEMTTTSESTNNDDPSKTNPVNAIDNKIEQAMDLVKSHLMYTVREEVEVLKEKIAELMERIQQLEMENNYLRSQIPKTAAGVPVSVGSGAATPAAAAASTSASGGSANVTMTVTSTTNVPPTVTNTVTANGVANIPPTNETQQQ